MSNYVVEIERRKEWNSPRVNIKIDEESIKLSISLEDFITALKTEVTQSLFEDLKKEI